MDRAHMRPRSHIVSTSLSSSMSGESFSLDELAARARSRGTRYLEFMRTPSMSLGLYLLSEGGPDPQTPHREDEVYLVRKGRAHLLIGDHLVPAQPGDLLTVPARTEHRFVDITEPLELLVVFAPAESSLSGESGGDH
jgi:mannose-6-phosphate isomerase-like protein (cupin superfamily)